MDLFTESTIRELSSNDFDNTTPYKLNKDGCCVVLFFAEWCGHCQHFKPEFKKFADKALFVDVYAVNVDTHASLIEHIKQSKDCPLTLKGWPTVWFYKDGIPVQEYANERTSIQLLKEVMYFCKG